MHKLFQLLKRATDVAEEQLLGWMDDNIPTVDAHNAVYNALDPFRKTVAEAMARPGDVHVAFDIAIDALTDLKIKRNLLDREVREIHEFSNGLRAIKRKFEERERDAIPF